MLEFYQILELEPHNIIALNGMGLGFGNYGEYEESKKYFKKTLDIKRWYPFNRHHYCLRSYETLHLIVVNPRK